MPDDLNDNIFILLATFEPDLNLLKEQISTIRDQTIKNWFCFVADDNSSLIKQNDIKNLLAGDSRFTFVSNTKRLGWVNNIEFGLNQAEQSPIAFSFVVISEQGDLWRSNRLEKSIQVLKENIGVSLVHNDYALSVNGLGETISSVWRDRQYNCDQITYESTLFLNVVAGKTAMFRRSVLKTALPFEKLAYPYPYNYDVWLVMHALFAGSIYSLDECLLTSYLSKDELNYLPIRKMFFEFIKQKGKSSIFNFRAKEAFQNRIRLANDFLHALTYNHIPISANTARAVSYIKENYFNHYLAVESLLQTWKLFFYSVKYSRGRLNSLLRGLFLVLGQFFILKKINIEPAPSENLTTKKAHRKNRR